MGASAAVQNVTWEEALRAGRVLFGTRADSLLAGSGWREELKRAYKRRVLETHPDRARTLGRAEGELAREFRAVTEAYRLLEGSSDARLWLRPQPTWTPPPSRAASSERAAHARHDARARQEPRARQEAPRGAERARAADPARQREAARRAQAAREAAAAKVRQAEAAARAAAAGSGEPSATDWRHVVKPRPFPRRRLRLAEFLYYSGRISWAVMVDAVAWQRRQRPAVGRIAVDFGILTPLEVIDVIARRQRAGAHDVPFGEYALRLGMITAFERLALIGRQTRLQRPIGQYFVERGILGDEEFEELRRQIVRHNLRHYV